AGPPLGGALALLAELGDLLLELGLLPLARAAADLEQLLLARHHALDFGVLLSGDKIGRKADAVRAIALGLAARLARRELVERLGDDGQIGAGLGLVEPHHDLARLDAIAVPDPQLADHAAGRMPALLHVRIHDEL